MLIENQSLPDLAPYSTPEDAQPPTVHVYVWKHDMDREELLAFARTHFPDLTLDPLPQGCGKRLVEVLSVRLLLRRLLGRETRLAYHDTGRPYIPGSPLTASISHSARLYALSLAPFRHGIDVEQWGDRALRLLPRFVSPEEAAALASARMPGLSDEQWATLLWSAKEAAYKYYDIPGTTLHPDFVLQPAASPLLRVACGKSPVAASARLEPTPHCALTCCAAREFEIK